VLDQAQVHVFVLVLLELVPVGVGAAGGVEVFPGVRTLLPLPML
jgi:hypothetical protein